MEQFNLKLAELKLETDRNIVGECFISRPDKNLTPELGVLFSIIEVYNTNDIFIDGFLEAIADLKTEYYLPPFNPAKSPEKRFEEAIARTNRRIFSVINQSVEEVDLRNISAVIGIAIKNKIFISATGRIKGLFFRKKKNGELLIADILSSSLEKKFKPEPEKIFANILNGELAAKDVLLFINDEWLGSFSQTELAGICLNNQLEALLKILNQSLQKKIIKNNFYCVAVKPDIPTEEITSVNLEKDNSTQSAEKHQTEKIIEARDEQLAIEHRKEKEPIEKINRPPDKSIEKLLAVQNKTEKYLTPSLMPNWQKLILMFIKWLKKSLIWLIIKTQEIIVTIIKFLKNLIKNRRLKNDSNIQEATESDYKASPAKDNKLKEKINLFLNNKIVIFLNLRLTQKIALVFGFFLLFAFIQSIVIIGRSLEKTGVVYNYETITKQIEEQLNKAEAQNIFNDEAGAMNAITKAKELLEEIPDKKSTQSFKNELKQKIEISSFNIQKIIYLENPEIIIDLDEGKENKGDYAGLAKTNKIFWIYDNNQRELIKLDTLTDNTDNQKSNLAIKKITSLDDKDLIILTTDNEYYRFETSKSSFVKISKPVKENFSLKPPEANLPLISPSLAEAEIVMSFSQDGYSFFLDIKHQRLVILDKNNNLKKQYYSSIISFADSLSFSAKEKKIWILSAGKIYQLEAEF
jgi:hypothetical protein